MTAAHALLWATIFFGFSCAPSVVVQPDGLTLPVRPALETCPDDPHVTGRMVGGDVILSQADAEKLRAYLQGLRVCAAANVIILEGHIEKLENRLRALGATS